MAERKFFTITWRIKNFSFCWQQDEQELSGPTFFIEELQGSKWKLFLFPKALRSKKWDSIACYLYHESMGNDLDEVEIDFELSALDCAGLPLETVSSTKCKMNGSDWSQPLLLPRYRVFIENRGAFLPKDVLTLRCRISLINQVQMNSERYFATTRIEVVKASLFGVLEKIDSFQGNKYRVNFISTSLESAPFFVIIDVRDRGPDAEIKGINRELVKFCKCKLHLTDKNGNEMLYGQDEFIFDSTNIPLYDGMVVWTIPLGYISNYNITQPHFEMENFFLRCEIEYSTGIFSEKNEKVDYSVNMFQNGCRIKEKRQEHLPSLKEDLLSLMQNEDYSDIKIYTKNKSFSAHSNILRARSLFFKTKLADPKEIGLSIHEEDMDDAIFYQVLVFLYTDTIENLTLGNALNLYIASARYGIPTLKQKCSSFLQSYLDSSNCCDVLREADRHQDGDLKKAAQNYILQNEDEVIGSDKWQNLDNLTELTEEIMCLKRTKN